MSGNTDVETYRAVEGDSSVLLITRLPRGQGELKVTFTPTRDRCFRLWRKLRLEVHYFGASDANATWTEEAGKSWELLDSHTLWPYITRQKKTYYVFCQPIEVECLLRGYREAPEQRLERLKVTINPGCSDARVVQWTRGEAYCDSPTVTDSRINPMEVGIVHVTIDNKKGNTPMKQTYTNQRALEECVEKATIISSSRELQFTTEATFCSAYKQQIRYKVQHHTSEARKGLFSRNTMQNQTVELTAAPYTAAEFVIHIMQPEDYVEVSLGGKIVKATQRGPEGSITLWSECVKCTPAESALLPHVELPESILVICDGRCAEQ